MLENQNAARFAQSRLAAFFGGCVLLFVATLAFAQGYPARTVRIVVPFTPGQGVDIVARAVAQRLTERWGHPVIVENKPGASGAIGSTYVAHAQADGHTLLLTSNGLITAPLLVKNPQYDALKDFEPIGLAGWTSMILVANPDSKLETLADLLRSAKAEPGKITYASTGVGLPHHLAMEMLKAQTGMDLLHVPYKGTTGAVSELLSGQVQVMYLPTPVAFPYLKAGSLRALALASSKRHPLAPDVPTFKELGYSGVDADLWYGLLAPRATPRAVVSKVESDFLAALGHPDVKAIMASALGIAEVTTFSSSQFKAFLSDEHGRWAAVIRRAGIKHD